MVKGEKAVSRKMAWIENGGWNYVGSCCIESDAKTAQTMLVVMFTIFILYLFLLLKIFKWSTKIRKMF